MAHIDNVLISRGLGSARYDQVGERTHQLVPAKHRHARVRPRKIDETTIILHIINTENICILGSRRTCLPNGTQVAGPGHRGP